MRPSTSSPLRRRLSQRSRSPYGVPLHVVHADCLEPRQDPFVLDGLCDGFKTHHMTDSMDRFDHGMIDGVPHHVFHETAVDLQEVYRKRLQMSSDR